MRRNQQLSRFEIMGWATLGLGSGLAAGFALSEWVGEVNRLRVRRVAGRIRQPAPVTLTSAAAVRAVEAALLANPELALLGLRVTPGGRGTVELYGWVPSRASRALARRAALAIPGVERVVNRILVRGEDDRPPADSAETDQPT